MRRARLRILVMSGAVVCVALFFITGIFFESGKPRYKGRSYLYWVSVLDQNVDAPDAIRHTGTNGIPCLLNLIERETTGMEAVKAILGHLTRRKVIEPYEISRNAASAFAILGAEAAPAIPVLLKLAQERRGSMTPYPRALAGIGPPVVPFMRAYLAHSDLYLRFVGVRTLLHMADQEIVRRETENAFPSLASCLADTSEESWDARNAILELIQRFPLRPDLAIPSLISVLDDNNEHLRGQAMKALSAYGPAAIDALPKLSEAHRAVQTNDTRSAQFILEIIQKIQPAATSADIPN